jgi:hypothetical protein
MTHQQTRAIARNLVIAATMGLAVFTSWAVTGARAPAFEIGTTEACARGAATAAAACKVALRHG